MIFHAHRCIFVHIPRTGGTSIENLLWPGPAATRRAGDLWMGFVDEHHNKYQTGGLQHLFAAHIRTEVGAVVFSSYFKFTIVRNPWDKAVSQYIFMNKHEGLRDFIGMKQGDSFKRYLELISRKAHVQWEPQVRFVRDSNGTLLVDYIGRYENFSKSVFHVLRSLGLAATPIPHENRSNRGPYRDCYDHESKEMIAKLYADDIEAFGYRYDQQGDPDDTPAAQSGRV